MTVIAVTGAAGFIGRHFCQSAGKSVKIVPLLRPGGSKIADGVVVDYESSENIRRALTGAEVVLHLAARAHVSQEKASTSEVKYRRVNFDLTRRVALAAVNANVRRFVFMSSAGVLGRSSPTEGFNDESQPSPHDAYTRSKLDAERWLADEMKGALETVIVRPPLVYGPDAEGNFGRLLRAVLTGRRLPLLGLVAPRSLIGVRNLGAFLRLCCTNARAPGAPLLVADPETTTIAALSAQIAALAGLPNRSFNVPAPVLALGLRMIGRRAEAARLTAPFVVRGQRAGRDLDWQPVYSRAEELEWTVRTHQRDER